jgi:hypothetical protein
VIIFDVRVADLQVRRSTGTVRRNLGAYLAQSSLGLSWRRECLSELVVAEVPRMNADRVVVDPADFRVDVLGSTTDEAGSTGPLFTVESSAAGSAVVVTLDDLNDRDPVIAHTFDRTCVRFCWSTTEGRKIRDGSSRLVLHRRPGRVLVAPATRALIWKEAPDPCPFNSNPPCPPATGGEANGSTQRSGSGAT